MSNFTKLPLTHEILRTLHVTAIILAPINRPIIEKLLDDQRHR